MKMLDANIVLRYILNDNEEMANIAEQLILNEKTMLTIEVLAEVVYVLNGLYKIPRNELKEAIVSALENIETEHPEVIETSMDTYCKTTLDFVDCVLYAYHKTMGYDICTFDKKLKKILESNK